MIRMCTTRIIACLWLLINVPAAIADEVTTSFWDSVLTMIGGPWVTETFITLPAVTFVAAPSRDSLSAFPFPTHAPSSEFGFEEERLAQYATFRSPGDFYLHGKAGYSWDTARAKDEWYSLSLDEMVDEFGTNGALGLGAGYRLNNGRRLEIEYSVNRRDEQIFRVGYTF